MNNITLKVENPDDVVLTLIASAKAKEWRQIKDALQVNEVCDPADCFKTTLSDLVDKANIELYKYL